MARWILDTNLLIYAMTAHPEYEARVRARLAEAEREGHILYIPAAVVAEVLYVLEGDSFGYSRADATRALERLIVSEGIECQDETAVLYALIMHREKRLDYVDGYCAGLAKEPDIALLTNDRELIKKSDAQIEIL